MHSVSLHLTGSCTATQLSQLCTDTLPVSTSEVEILCSLVSPDKSAVEKQISGDTTGEENGFKHCLDFGPALNWWGK